MGASRRRETKFRSLRFPAAVTDGDAKMKKTLVILASLLAFGTASMSAASAKTVIIKKGGHHHMHGGKKIIIKHGHGHHHHM
jgi:hypothetical protein